MGAILHHNSYNNAVAGYITRIVSYLYVAIILTLVSFYWMFREQIIKKFRSK